MNIKKIFLTIIAIVMVTAGAWAVEVEIDGINYNVVTRGKAATVISKKDTRYMGDVEIPASIIVEEVEFTVTSIGEAAFSGCTGLTSVNIPSSVTSIGEVAFSGCTGLTSVDIPSSVTTIGGSCFSGCKRLTSVTIPSSITSIGSGTFYGCKSLSSVNIPSSVTSIGEAAFSGCTGLTSVNIPSSVTTIGNEAFYGCTSLTSLIIPSSITSIENRTFCNCTALTSVNIPSSVTSIGDWAFSGCAGLTSMIIPSSVTSIGQSAFSVCTGLTSVIIPPSVTRIRMSTFEECTGLTSVTIPSSVIYIDPCAFQNCTGLTSVTIPLSVISIGSYAFNGCKGLISVSISSSVNDIRGWAFYDCAELADVYCYAETPPRTEVYYEKDIFYGSYPEYSTLHVPTSAIEAYRGTEPWSKFGTIVAIDGIEPVVPQCEKPTIHFANGKLSFQCETEGVEFVSEITDADIKKYYSSEIDLSATYNITVYAQKTDYEDSEITTATLCWIEAEPQTEGITDDAVSVKEVKAVPVLIQTSGTQLSIEGAPAGAGIAIFDLNGRLIGQTKAAATGTTKIAVPAGEKMLIVKVGEKSVKVVR